MLRSSIAPRSLFLFPAIFVLLGWVMPFDVAQAQARRDIAVLVAQAKTGAVDEVSKLLPALKKSHPDKAGVLFLEALLESNAEKAVELYQRVADEYSGSEWSDDALYRLYQYSFAVGAYRTARSYIERISKDYPKSPFLTREQQAAAKEAAAATKGSAAKEANSTTQTSAAKSAAAREKDASTSSAGSDAAAGDDANGTDGSYAVQVGAYSREADARKQMDDLKTKGYTAYMREKNVNGKKIQSVWLGIFPDFAQAQAFARKLKEQQNIDVLVVRR
ncbi:MAG: SPOR domain-containing protein [Bacteroidota bacterium]